MFDPSDESLLYAFSSLLNSLKIDVDYNTLREELAGQDLNFDVLADGERVHIVERGEYGSWPQSNNAIIKFQYQDQDEPYIELEDGNRDANIVDHYCRVHDYQQKQIVDSADGVIKESNLYGLPVSWVVFEPGSAPKGAQPKIDPERSYKVLKGGESGWEIARKLGINGTELKEHNLDDFEDFGDIPAGTVLHLPTRLVSKPEAVKTEFEFLRRPLEMHVSKPGGTKKYTFGNVTKGITPTGPTSKENKNLLIYVVAYVPVGGEIKTFYMEGGDVDTGRKKIKWTVGFRQEDVAEEHVEAAAPEPSPAAAVISQKLDEAAERKKQLDAVEAERLAMIDDVNAEDNPPSRRQGSDSLPLEDPDYNENWWKQTYKPLNDERKPEVFLFNQDVVVTDLEGKCQNKFLRRLDGVRVAGTFTGPDNREYYRPQDAMDLFTWYGIPQVDPETGEAVLIAEAELYNTDLTLAERSTMRHGRLTAIERYFTVPLAKATARSSFLRRYADKVKQNKE